MFSISKMLRTPVLGKGRKVKHHYKTFRTVLSMMVEFNLARQVLGVKHKHLDSFIIFQCEGKLFVRIVHPYLLPLLCQALIYILRKGCLRQRHLMVISDMVSCMRLFSNPIIMTLRRPHKRRNLLIYSLWLINMFNLKKYNYDFRLQN